MGPQRTEALFAPFAKQPDLVRLLQLQSTGPQVEEFLDPCPGVEHGSQQGIVAPPGARGTIHGLQHRLELRILQRVNGPVVRAFKRDLQDPVRAGQLLRLVRGDVAKKSLEHAG